MTVADKARVLQSSTLHGRAACAAVREYNIVQSFGPPSYVDNERLSAMFDAIGIKLTAVVGNIIALAFSVKTRNFGR